MNEISIHTKSKLEHTVSPKARVKVPKNKKKVDFRIKDGNLNIFCDSPDMSPSKDHRESTKSATNIDIQSIWKLRKMSTIANTLTSNKIKINDGVRRDAYGTQIVKNSKTHKITFADIVNNENLVQCVYIPKYDHKNIYDGVNCQCTCMIF